MFVVTNTCLSQQNTSFVTTKVCLSKTFVVTNTNVILSRQNFCCNKLTFVATNTCLLWQIFVATKIFCHDKSFVAASILLSLQKRCFVASNTCFSWQKFYLWQLPPIIDFNILSTTQGHLRMMNRRQNPYTTTVSVHKFTVYRWQDKKTISQSHICCLLCDNSWMITVLNLRSLCTFRRSQTWKKGKSQQLQRHGHTNVQE